MSTPPAHLPGLPGPGAGPGSGPAFAIAAHGLTRRFGDFTAVDSVSFDVATSEVFGFLGPNGAGKTTTIRMLTGLLAPSAGRVRVAGLELPREQEALRSRIGYMSQKFSLYGDLTVVENIDLFAGLYGVRGERLARRRAWVLDLAGLAGDERRITADLPLGFKQRLALGCAVVHEPPILFLDEPTSGVDPLARRSFWDVIDALARAGTTVLVSTHYMEEAEYCNRLALMNRGRLIALDSPARLRAAYDRPIFTLTSSNAPRAVEALRGRPGIEDAAMFGRAVHVVADDVAAAEASVRSALASYGDAFTGMEPVPPSLEDVFVGLVRREGGALEG